MANIITNIRILISILLLLCTAFSPTFYALYITAGFSDMIDGIVARKTNNVSEFGSTLDTIADLVFITICLIKLLPIMEIPFWLCVWIFFIAAIKLINIILGYAKQNKVITVHSFMNRITGGILFIFPLALPFINPKFGAIFICSVASVAAIQEGYFILSSSCLK